MTELLSNFLWKFAVLVIGSPLLTALVSAFVAGLATLVAGFGGAWAAFRLQERKNADRQKVREMQAINQLMLILTRQVSFLKIYQTDYIEQYREVAGRHLSIGPVDVEEPVWGKVNFQELSFLADGSAAALLHDLWLVEQDFLQAVSFIKRRSQFHLDVLQPKMAKWWAPSGDYSQEELEKNLGRYICKSMESLTNMMILTVDKAIESNLKVADVTHKRLSEKFPDQKFIRFQMASEEELAAKAKAFADQVAAAKSSLH
jgi:hypothetical protein